MGSSQNSPEKSVKMLLLKYCFMDPYRNQTKRTLLSKSYTKDNGLVDSVKYLLYKYNNQNKHLLNRFDMIVF